MHGVAVRILGTVIKQISKGAESLEKANARSRSRDQEDPPPRRGANETRNTVRDMSETL